MPRHTYAAAERFLLAREFFGLKLGLENITEFLTQIGNPQHRYPTVHLAGTNGKGSIAAMLAAIFRAQGYKTGLFTSPHLVDFRERVQVNGRKIPSRSVAAYVDRHRKEITRRQLSFFETVTAMAFEHFRRAKVDIAVIETGLGGRFDATNVLEPLVTLTTDIGRDHLEILGDTIPKIAYEKAGIIKPGVPHVVGHLPRDAEAVIRRRCRECDAPMIRLMAKDYRVLQPGISLEFAYNGYSFRKLRPALMGPHQMRNAALALKTASVIDSLGMRLSRRAVREGMTSVSWPGRFQVVERKRSPNLVLDVGHNVGGAKAFADSFEARFPGRKAHILTGFVKRKEHQAMFDALSRIAVTYTLVPLATRRTTDVRELIATIDWREIPVRRMGSLKTAYRKLSESLEPDDIIAVIGSHFLVGEFMKTYRVH